MWIIDYSIFIKIPEIKYFIFKIYTRDERSSRKQEDIGNKRAEWNCILLTLIDLAVAVFISSSKASKSQLNGNIRLIRVSCVNIGRCKQE